MIIRGILDRSLSNQICIRGFARIKELARISKANPEYQRELLIKQKDVVSNFLTEETYLFFPEVILSLKLRQDVTIKGAKAEDPKSDYKLDFYFTYEKDAHITLKEEILKHIKAVLVDVYKFKILS